jgi:hypothetical protein
MMPQKESKATGNMNVLPRLWKNSQRVILGLLAADITDFSWRKDEQKGDC